MHFHKNSAYMIKIRSKYMFNYDFFVHVLCLKNAMLSSKFHETYRKLSNEQKKHYIKILNGYIEYLMSYKYLQEIIFNCITIFNCIFKQVWFEN